MQLSSGKRDSESYPWNSDSIVNRAFVSLETTSATLSPPSGGKNGSFSSKSHISWYCEHKKMKKSLSKRDLEPNDPTEHLQLQLHDGSTYLLYHVTWVQKKGQRIALEDHQWPVNTISSIWRTTTNEILTQRRAYVNRFVNSFHCQYRRKFWIETTKNSAYEAMNGELSLKCNYII